LAFEIIEKLLDAPSCGGVPFDLAWHPRAAASSMSCCSTSSRARNLVRTRWW
jgi:hypothetical protein